MAVENAVNINDLEEGVSFPVPRVAFIGANSPKKLRIILRYPVGAYLMIAHDEYFARRPPLTVPASETAYLLFHWKTKALERFIADKYIIGVPRTLQRSGARLLVTVEAMMIPMVAQVDNHIRLVMHDGLGNPIYMVERYARTDLGVWNYEVTSRLPLSHALVPAVDKALDRWRFIYPNARPYDREQRRNRGKP